MATGFLLLPVGMDFVQAPPVCLVASMPAPAVLLVCNLLYINQFPDRSADLQAGKRHWVAVWRHGRHRWGYVLIAIVAYLLSTIWIRDQPPAGCASSYWLYVAQAASSCCARTRHRQTLRRIYPFDDPGSNPAEDAHV